MDITTIQELTTESMDEFLTGIYKLRDSNSPLRYIVVNEAMHNAIIKHLFGDNQYKVRVEEIGGMKYTASAQWNDKTTPKCYLCPIDVAKIVAVYTDFDGNAVMIEDLFNSNYKEWTINN